MLTLADAWNWVQIGFCAGVGACAVYFGSAIVYSLNTPGVHAHVPEDPHCSRCCPTRDDD